MDALFGDHPAGRASNDAGVQARGCRKSHLIIGVAVGDVLGRSDVVMRLDDLVCSGTLHGRAELFALDA